MLSWCDIHSINDIFDYQSSAWIPYVDLEMKYLLPNINKIVVDRIEGLIPDPMVLKVGLPTPQVQWQD
jgi:hypothetical protein